MNSKTTDSDRQALERLLIDNPELEKLEARLAQFNIFEILGAVNVELRHSEFLAYLFDPLRNHGLGDAFIKRLLQAVLAGADPAGLPVRPIDLEVWDLDDLEVRREWQGIDILLLSPRNRLVVAIENKIRSGEHAHQLVRYRQYVEKIYEGWAALYLYLTPEGDLPSDEEHYLPVSYRLVCEVLGRLIHTRQSSLGPEILIVLNHYIQMLRRHIVSDDIANLCRQIYRKHKTAIDLIIENIPSRQAAIKEILEALLIESSDIVLPDKSALTYINFIPKTWDTPVLRQGGAWSNANRILMFYFENRPDYLRISLSIGPGPADIRQKLLDIALHHHPPFRSAYAKLNQKWNSIYQFQMLTQKDFEEMEDEELVEKIKSAWQKFLNTDLRQMEAVLRKQAWIWQDVAPDAKGSPAG